ncbi:MAG: tripartite tricarboxylate transporter substrate binding protein [Desulfuromonadales bacterium]|nr:tripartite tricarboxylate transporter substrate binding protein [Desulfuromonadales bacterium]MDW7758766.1 tripartite tricarboxylate transporter substrate binding protein [Desulfuromonadales bacterium]
MKGLKIGIFLALVTTLALSPMYARAEKFPEKPLNYILCFNPGGESDITARIQEAPLKKYFPDGVVISYKIGGGGSVGWSELIQSKPDGYTIAGNNLPHIVLQPLTRGNAGYQTLDLKPICFFQSTPNILVVRKDSPFKTLKDFIDYAKEHPNVVTAGGSGSSSANELGVQLLNKAAGIKITYIPFTGSGAATPALLGGHVGSLMTYSTMAVQYQDKFRPLAIMTEERMAILPDVPTFKELGYDIVEGAYRGVAAPPGTPDDRIQYIAESFAKVMEEPEVIKKMNENGFKKETMGPAESEAFIKEKMVEYEALLGELGMLKK